MKSLLIPLMEKVDKLTEVSEELHKIEESITTQHTELKDSLTSRIEESNNKLERALNENTSLRKECNILKDRLEQMEMLQLSNNVIIIGIPEQQWENYKSTKQ